MSRQDSSRAREWSGPQQRVRRRVAVRHTGRCCSNAPRSQGRGTHRLAERREHRVARAKGRTRRGVLRVQAGFADQIAPAHFRLDALIGGTSAFAAAAQLQILSGEFFVGSLIQDIRFGGTHGYSPSRCGSA